MKVSGLDAVPRALAMTNGSIEKPPAVDLPAPGSLELENAMTPREAFFARVEQVPIAEAPVEIPDESRIMAFEEQSNVQTVSLA